MRFAAFKYDSYYPGGAKQDFDAVFESLDAAIASQTTGEFMDVFDCKTGDWHSFVNRHGRWITPLDHT